MNSGPVFSYPKQGCRRLKEKWAQERSVQQARMSLREPTCDTKSHWGVQKQGNPSHHTDLTTHDFRCYDETLKANTALIARRSQHNQAKNSTTCHPQAGQSSEKAPTWGRARLIFFLPGVPLLSAAPCSIPLAAAGRSFTVHIEELSLGCFAYKVFFRKQRSYSYLESRARKIARDGNLMWGRSQYSGVFNVL